MTTVRSRDTQITLADLQAAIIGQSRQLVYQFGCGKGTGFCADMTWMMTQLVKCLQFGYGFSLGRVTHPTNFCISKGWEDFFLPFCGEVSAPGLQVLNDRMFSYSRRASAIRPIIRTWLRAKTYPPANYFMFDQLADLSSLSPPFFWNHQPFFSACAELLTLIWKYNKPMSERVASWKAHIPNPPHLSLIIRRGDKDAEHPYVAVTRYLEVIGSLPRPVGIVFIASDDDRIISEFLDAAPRLEAIVLPSLGLQGYHHASFSSLPPDEKLWHLARFFAQLEICMDSSVCIGSPTTNVTTFVRMLRGDHAMLMV